jgi:hypothetical protein
VPYICFTEFHLPEFKVSKEINVNNPADVEKVWKIYMKKW